MSATPPSGRAAVDADRTPRAASADRTVDDHAGPATADARVVVEDVPTVRVHHPTDLLNAVLAAVAVVLVLALALYAPNTTSGVAEDVQGFAVMVRRILFVPVQGLEVVVALVIPLAVLAELAIRRLGRQLLEGVTAAVLAVALNEALRFVINQWASEDLAHGLSIRVDGDLVVSLPPAFAMVVALLSVAGPRGRRRTVDWSWNVLWITAAVLLIIGRVSLPGVVVSLLVGRVAGMVVRYVSGVRSERAYGTSLLDGIRRAGFEPARLSRVADETTSADAARVAEREGTDPVELDGSPAARALTRSTGNRVYELTTTTGDELDVVVIDGDRQVVGGLERLWRSIRMRGIEGRSVVSLRQATSRAALQAYAARAAGVRTPQLLSLAEAEDSMLLVQERPGRAVPLAELPPERLTDDLLREIWAQLQLAHAAGVAHRALTGDVVLVDDLVGQPVVWLTGWQQGDVASSELARRMDVTQLVALLALRVGATRALESAAAVLPESDLAAVGPLLQTITLPRETREEMRAHKEVLAELRTALVARLPEASVEPEQLVRFGARTVLTILLSVVAVFVILTTINVEEIGDALAESDWRWSVVAFALGMSTLVSAALAFVAFSPVRLPVWRATLVQTAATFVALAAPAGIGPAALNLRMLNKRGVSTTLSAATVALVQVSQFIVTLALLLGLTILSGRSESQLPISGAMLVAIGIVAVLVAAALLVPPVRQWVLAKSLPTLQRTWPRLIEVLGQPWRLALAVGGNLAMTLGYILAFDACLQALNQDASLIQVALVYLAGNTAGALVPTPGGMGAIEATLALSLTTITGMNAGVATSIAVLFRALTYWLRIPFGWAAMRFLQRRGEL